MVCSTLLSELDNTEDPMLKPAAGTDKHQNMAITFWCCKCNCRLTCSPFGGPLELTRAPSDRPLGAFIPVLELVCSLTLVSGLETLKTVEL